MPAILSPSGISKATREYFKLVRWLGLPVSTLLGVDEQLPLLEKAVVQEMIASNGPIPQGEEFVHFYVGPPGSMGMMPGAVGSLGIFFFEGIRLTSVQIGPSRMIGLIGAPSSFCHAGLLRSGIPKAKVRNIPVPLDENTWNPSVEPAFPKEGRFRFLYMNSIYERKGLDVLLRAYWQAFSKSDPVELVIKSYRENDRPDPASKYVSSLAEKHKFIPSQGAPVRVIDYAIHDEDVPSFIKSFDAVVSTHRSEGFGLTPFYAMALGVPVVVTDFGGVTDFCRDDTSWLVSVEKMSSPSNVETKIFGHLRGSTWAEPSVEAAAQAMRDCLEKSKERFERADRGRTLVRENYSYAKTAMSLLEALETACPGFKKKSLRMLTSAANERYEGRPFRMLEL